MFLDAGADRLDNLEIDAEEIVAAHSGFARNAGRHDDNIGACYGFIIIASGERHIKTFDRSRFGKIERLALRCSFGNIVEHDVAELIERREVSQSAADLTCTNQSDFVARHELLVLLCPCGRTLGHRETVPVPADVSIAAANSATRVLTVRPAAGERSVAGI